MTTRIRGAVILARRAFVIEERGEETWERILDALPADDRRVLRDLVVPVSWYPFALTVRLDEAMVAHLDDGVEAFERIGARSARQALAESLRPAVVAGDVQGLLAKAGSFYNFYYDSGYREYEPTGAGSGTLTTYATEAFSITDCRTVVGWYREALGMCGAAGVEVREETCRAGGGPYCRYRVRWRDPAGAEREAEGAS